MLHQETTTEPAQPADTRSTTSVAREASVSAIFRPTTLTAAFDALSERPDALLLAGGTDALVEINARRLRPNAVVALRRVQELQGYRISPDGVTIGAGATWAVIEHELAHVVPALAAAARTVGSPQIRAAGTLGGNLGTFRAAGVALPVLLGLDATITLRRRDQRRTISMADYTAEAAGRTGDTDEVITAVHLPRLHGPQQFLKLGARNAMTESVCSVLVAMDRATRAVRVGIGAVGRVPLRATEAEQFLAEALDWDAQRAQPEVLMSFARLVRDAACATTSGPQASYRAHAAGVLAARGAARCLAEEVLS